MAIQQSSQSIPYVSLAPQPEVMEPGVGKTKAKTEYVLNTTH